MDLYILSRSTKFYLLQHTMYLEKPEWGVSDNFLSYNFNVPWISIFWAGVQNFIFSNILTHDITVTLMGKSLKHYQQYTYTLKFSCSDCKTPLSFFSETAKAAHQLTDWDCLNPCLQNQLLSIACGWEISPLFSMISGLNFYPQFCSPAGNVWAGDWSPLITIFVATIVAITGSPLIFVSQFVHSCALLSHYCILLHICFFFWNAFLLFIRFGT